jgi:hypothetical protein
MRTVRKDLLTIETDQGDGLVVGQRYSILLNVYRWWLVLASTVRTGMIGMCACAVGSAVIITEVTPLMLTTPWPT